MPKGIYDRTKRPATNGRKPVTSLVPDTHPDDYDDDHDYEPPAPPPAPSGLTDPDAIYGVPREVEVSSLQRQRLIGAVWEELYEDILLRLEKTPASKALEYPFKNATYVNRAYNALVERFEKRQGKGYVKLVTRKTPPALAAFRGPNWRKLE